MASPDLQSQSFWTSSARLCSVQINAARWLETANPWLLGLCLGWACVVLLMRGLGSAGGWLWIVPSVAAMAIVFERAFFLRRSQKWFGVAQAFILLEDRLGLKSRLSVAREGLIPWPPAPETLPRLFHFHGGRLLGPPLLGVSILAAAAWVPVGGANRSGDRKGAERPQVLNQLEGWVESIEQEKLVEQEAVEELRKQFEALDDLGPEEWFKHSTLEAADHLRDRTEQELKQLDRRLEETRQLLMEAARMDEMAPPSQAKAWEQDYQQALNALRAGGMPLDPSLLEKLNGLNPGQIRSMNEQDLQKALDRLKNGQSMCQSCTGGGELKQILEDFEKGNNLAEGNEGAGRGGINRGPGTAPLSLKSEESRTDAGQEGALTSQDLSQAAFGDVTGITQGRHEVDAQGAEANRDGGAVLSHGRGGDAVWTTPLTPDEQQAVRRFFE